MDMEMSLADNIRAMRKQRRLTQEQLAEVLGVTAGAVYKWESGLSVPELGLLVEMADFFDVSVDALLGYRRKDNRESAIIKRLGEFSRSRSPEVFPEAEMALKRYPNSFDLVYCCAEMYLIYGAECRDREKLFRALELLEQSLRLLDQKQDPERSEFTLYGEIAAVYVSLGEEEKGLELLKKYNAGGVFNDFIGTLLSVFLGRCEDAEPYLSKALLQSAGTLFDSIVGWMFIFLSRKDLRSAQEILNWGISVLQGFKRETGAPDFLDKLYAKFYILLSHTQLITGQRAEALASVRLAADYSARFDAKPDYSFVTLRFAASPETIGYDILGATAAEGVGKLIELLGNQELHSLWKEALADGQN